MPKRILLADDSITIQKVVELTFSDGDYEVVAVNNGARAIQKLGEMRPDIILSDIIMPEKNGYEVCEFVKSHPEFRNIPVVLLTGTFEPFDPDRADKAGCDAVVTKPFESQSLIQRVEELIDQARAAATTIAAPAVSAPAAAPEPPPIAAEPAPWETPSAPSFAPTTTFAPQQSGFSSASGSVPAVPDPFAGGFATNDNDIFSAAPHPAATTEMPFDAPEPPAEYSPETRAFPRMSFDELQAMANAPAAPETPSAPSAPEPASPWDEPAAEEPPAFGGETRAFPRMSFDELQSMANAPAAEAPSTPSTPSAPAATHAPEPASPWDEPAAEEPAAFGGETRAFPRMSFDELQSMQNAPEPASPWDVKPEPSEPERPGIDPAFAAPPLAPPSFEAPSFEDPAIGTTPFAPAESEPVIAAPEPASPWDEPALPAAESHFAESEPAQPQFDDSPFAAEPAASFDEPAPSPSYEEPPAFASVHQPEPEPVIDEPETEAAPAWSPTAPEPRPVPSPELIAQAAEGADLTDDQIERIARRVVQLMSEQVVRNIAWEVIPDVAEMAVKQRIRELEAE